MTGHPHIERLETLVDELGEAHCTVEEIDDEVELRSGATTFDYDAGLIVVDGPDTKHFFGMDRVVHFYAPKSVFH